MVGWSAALLALASTGYVWYRAVPFDTARPYMIATVTLYIASHLLLIIWHLTVVKDTIYSGVLSSTTSPATSPENRLSRLSLSSQVDLALIPRAWYSFSLPGVAKAEDATPTYTLRLTDRSGARKPLQKVHRVTDFFDDEGTLQTEAFRTVLRQMLSDAQKKD